MSILIGYGKNKNKDNGQTYISGFFSDEFLALCPQFKDFRLILNYIPEEKRKDKEKSPCWAIEIYKAQNKEKTADEEPIIPM